MRICTSIPTVLSRVPPARRLADQLHSDGLTVQIGAACTEPDFSLSPAGAGRVPAWSCGMAAAWARCQDRP